MISIMFRLLFKDKNLMAMLLISFLFIFFYTPENVLNTLFYDVVLKQKEVKENHAVIIAIDDKSIQTIGRWPWPRKVHAQLVDKLASAKPVAIGFDILFVDPDLAEPTSDVTFAKAIANTANIVLPLSPNFEENASAHELLPSTIFLTNKVVLGHNDFELDTDGVMRKVYLYAGWQQAKWPSFALSLAQIMQPNKFIAPDKVSKGNFWTRQKPINIAFNSIDIPTLSYSDVLSGDVDNTIFNHKVILIGVTASGLGERFTTPTSMSHQRLSGVEINGHIVNALLSDATITLIPNLGQYAFAAIIVLLAILCLSLLNSAFVLISLAGLIIATFVIATGSLLVYNLWLDPLLPIGLLLLIILYLLFFKVKFYKNNLLQLNQKIYTDNATQLPNAEKVNLIINELILSAQLEKKPFPVIIINIGKFNAVNDLVGFSEGNNLLKLITKRIQYFIDEQQVIARHTGTEFIVTGLGRHKEDDIKLMCNNINVNLSKILSIKNESFTLPISIGVSTYPHDGLSAETLINCATSAMQRAKERSGRGVCFYHKHINQETLERHHFENDLAHALEKNEIEVYYQPQVNAQTSEIVGVEALARWLHPVKGYIPPTEFIPIAESTGLINEIGEWILRTACQQIKICQLTYGIPIKLGVNVSAIQFNEELLIKNIEKILNDTGFNAQYLELELTESCLIDNMGNTENILSQLKKLNINLSIDDFGTGYSSLSYLKSFPIDRIKIDRSFIKDINDSDDANKIVLAIISMAQSLNMSTIAEGIELIEQQKFLQKHHCDELQGYLFSKPLSYKDLESLLKKGRFL